MSRLQMNRLVLFVLVLDMNTDDSLSKVSLPSGFGAGIGACAFAGRASCGRLACASGCRPSMKWVEEASGPRFPDMPRTASTAKLRSQGPERQHHRVPPEGAAEPNYEAM